MGAFCSCVLRPFLIAGPLVSDSGKLLLVSLRLCIFNYNCNACTVYRLDPIANQNDPDDIYDDDHDSGCNDHRQGPRQPTVNIEETTSISDVDAREATYGLSSAGECNYSASCESPQPDRRKIPPKKLKPRLRRLSQKYEMMSPSSTDEVQVEVSCGGPPGIWSVANEDAASKESHGYTAHALVELSAMGKSVRHFMFTKSEEERESRVCNVRSLIIIMFATIIKSYL
jgi:hypothetical protein